MKKTLALHAASLLVPGVLALMASSAQAQEIVRHKIPGSDFPIAQAVTLPPSATIHFISGQVPPVIDKAAPADTLAAYGDTKVQTMGVLKKIDEILKGMGLAMGDVVKMQVFLPRADAPTSRDSWSHTPSSSAAASPTSRRAP
jgi:enamine deaminase RidA (YjgF/YER057c/UK114 family)